MKNILLRVTSFLLVAVFAVASTLSPLSAVASVATQTWTTQSTPEDNVWQATAWSPSLSLFVAVSSTGTHQVMTSPDGATWTVRNQAATSTWASVAWSPSLSLFVAVAATGANPVMTSPDGINWTQQTAPSNNWRNVIWVPQTGLFVAVSGAATTSDIMTSPDGITWTSRTTPAWGFFGTTYSPSLGLYVSVGWATSATNVMTSPDAVTWTLRTGTTSSNQWRGVTWSPDLGLFVAVGDSGTNRIMTSPDGINWTGIAAPEDSNNWSAISWSPELGIFTAVASSGTNRVMTSPDGVTWTARANSVADLFLGITWSSTLGKFVALGAGVAGQRVMTSNTTAPVLSSIGSGTPGATSATVTWTSDISSSSQVNYGLTGGYGSSTTLDSTLVKSHSVPITGLTCGTTYHYQVVSAYAGQSTSSGDNTFATTSCAVSPTVTTTTPTQLSSSSETLAGNITATGGAAVTVRGFEYGATTSYGLTVSESGSFSTGVFTLDASSLACGADYHYRAYATNTSGTSYGADAPFTVAACPSTGGNINRGHPELPVITTTPAAPSTTAPVFDSGTAFQFRKTLKLGMTDIDVLVLQEFLNRHDAALADTGTGSIGHETRYYGVKTSRAVKMFQELHADTILTPLGLTKGTGYFGPSTMAAVNAVLKGI